MKKPWKRSLIAIAFAATILVADIGMGLELSSLFSPDRTLDDAGAAGDGLVDSVERVWEGGGSHLAFVDTMSSGLATYLEGMDPLRDAPGDDPFDYYGGAVAQIDPGEVPGRWGPERWRHEWWRWGEESLQEGEPATGLWRQQDALFDGLLGDVYRFGEPDDLARYPQEAFSAIVSPVVDLRDVEPVTRDREEEAEYRLRSPPPTPIPGFSGIPAVDIHDIRQNITDASQRTGVAEVGTRYVGMEAPAVHNASAALRLAHEYGFHVEGNALSDGGRVEISRFDPALGWQDWEALVASQNKLRVGEDELEGRYAPHTGDTGAGLGEPCRQVFSDAECSLLEGPPLEGSSAVDAHAHLGDELEVEAESGGNVVQGNETGASHDFNVSARPWLYRGLIDASGSRDPTRGPWMGFGGSSEGIVESVFDLSEHAGHVVRFRFVVATQIDDQPHQGLGWLLEQLEVHALAEEGVKVLAPVTPTEGALLGASGGDTDHAQARPVVALQNTALARKEVNVHFAVENTNGTEGSTTRQASLPPGPWGRVFVTADESLQDLGVQEGLHFLRVGVVERLDALGEASVAVPVPLDEARSHFLRVGEDWDEEESWRVVRLVTQLLPREGDDEVPDPSARTLQRNQRMLVHVDLENLGPEPLEIAFPNATAAPLWPELHNNRGNLVGEATPLVDQVTLLPSREAAGSLGHMDGLARMSWEWDGSPNADILELFLMDPGAGERVLEAGMVRVEATSPTPLHVDMGNRWNYVDPATSTTGCHRAAEAGGRANVLVCRNEADITSPAEPVMGTVFQRVEPQWREARLIVVHHGGAGKVSFEVVNTPVETGDRPPSGGWEQLKMREYEASTSWEANETHLHTFAADWTGWIRVRVESTDAQKEFLVDEVRIEVGPEGRRLPLAWHAFAGDMFPEPSGRIVPLGEQVAVLHGTSQRVTDHHEEPIRREDFTGINLLSFLSFHLEDDELFFANSAGTVHVTVDTVTPGVSSLILPEPYTLDGARPTLRFLHWMGPSVAATGYVEVARIDRELHEQLERPETKLEWEPVATFKPPREAGDATMQPAEVTLPEYAGETVFVRFRYAYDAALQPGIAPWGWVLDAVTLEQTTPQRVEALQPTSRNFSEEGYSAFPLERVDFSEEPIEPMRRSSPDIQSNLFRFTNGDDSGIMICAGPNNPNTKHVGQSVITDPVDLRATSNPVLELEHQGFLTRDGTDSRTPLSNAAPGSKIFDLEWQILGPNGEWGEWNRATPFRPWSTWPATPGGWSGERLDGGLRHPPAEGEESGPMVTSPFTEANRGMSSRGITAFDLTSGGENSPAGEIVQFRFIVWEEWSGFPGTPRFCEGTGGSFSWSIYSMRVFDDSHVFDAAVTDIRVSPDDDDRALVDELAPGLRDDWRDDEARWVGDEIVVSGGGSGFMNVEVDVANEGLLDHVANVTLGIVDADGVAVSPSPRVDFVDRSGAVARLVEDRNHGAVALTGSQRGTGETATLVFRVHVGDLEPGEYRFRASVALDDAVDSNPANDIRQRALWVTPLRALDLDPHTLRVDPTAGTPDADRMLHLDLRNRGNVEEQEVTVNARVVELVGFGTEQDIAKNTTGHLVPYKLVPETVENRAPGTRTSITWDLNGDRVGDLPELRGLLEPGSRYAVNITIEAGDVDAWWMDGGVIPDEMLHTLAQPPGERCGCWHVPFIVDDLIAGSDLTPEGTTDVLGWSQADTTDDLISQWEIVTRYREDGRMQLAGDRDDLPGWRLVTAQQASDELGRGDVQGAAWHLPAYDGYERLEHELVSPPLPGQVIDNVSRGILGLRYASDLKENQADLEIRSLEPGGDWGPWRMVDDLRMQRVAVILPPDFPRVVSDNLTTDTTKYPLFRQGMGAGEHPIPPFYTGDAWDAPCGGADGLCDYWAHMDDEEHPEESTRNTHGLAGATPGKGTGQGGCSNRNNASCIWSPFPQFREPDHEANLDSVQGLAIVLQRLLDTFGSGNVGVFTTFPEDHETTQDYGEFEVPRETLGALGIEFEPGPPRLRVQGEDVTHEVVVQEMDELSRRVDTYGTLLLMGDGLARWAASTHGRSVVLDGLAQHPDNADTTRAGVTLPVDPTYGSAELERHFEDLLPALRFAATEGVQIISATGPATAVLGASGAAESVSLSFWIPESTTWDDQSAHFRSDWRDPWRPGQVSIPWVYRCLVEIAPPSGDRGRSEVTLTGYWLNVTEQPKSMCYRQQTETVGQEVHPTNYLYVSAQDAQAGALRELLVQGGARLSHADRITGPGQCELSESILILSALRLNPDTRSIACVVPNPVTVDRSGDVTFITAPFAGTESVENWASGDYWNGLPFSSQTDVGTWVDTIIDEIESRLGESGLPAGTNDWETLPVSRGAPTAGVFTRDDAGRDRFVGDTVQFRIRVASDPFDPEQPGHGSFFLDSYHLLGTPAQDANPLVRVANPAAGALFTPGDPFQVAVEVVNRGMDESEPFEVRVAMEQIPGIGDCGGNCRVSEFFPGSPIQVEPTVVTAPSLPGGERVVITLGDSATGPGLGVPDHIVRFEEADVESLNDGVFPRKDQGGWQQDFEMIFNVNASVDDDVHDTVRVHGATIVRDLLNDPGDVRIGPSQVILEASGSTSDSLIPVSEVVEIDVRLSNTGSFPLQRATVRVDVYWALPHDCWSDNDMGRRAFWRCEPNRDEDGGFIFRGGRGDYGQRMDRVYTSSELVQVPRGSTLAVQGLDLPLREMDRGPGVYQVDVTVTTDDARFEGEVIESPEPNTVTRWIYVGDPDDPDAVPWAAYEDDLAGIDHSAVNQAFPPTPGSSSTAWFIQERAVQADRADDPNGDAENNGRFQGTTNHTCQEDPRVTDSTEPGQGNRMRHGWAVSGDGYPQNGDCEDRLSFGPDGGGLLQWVRDGARAAGETSGDTNQWNQNAGNNANAPNNLGLGDFGPGRVIWYPGHDVSPHEENRATLNDLGFLRDRINGVAPTLANFAPGEAALVLDTRFHAPRHTGYVVEMQVPMRECWPTPEGSSSARAGCRWIWNWGDNDEHWFPLRPMEIDGTSSVNWAHDLRDSGEVDPNNRRTPNHNQGVCFDRPGQNQCFREAPTNPLVTSPGVGGEPPGIWDRTSSDLPQADGDGWVTLRYPIDPESQNGLNNYCLNFRNQIDPFQDAAQQDRGDTTGRFTPPVGDPFLFCLYTHAMDGNDIRGGQGENLVNHEIPRPVAFRFSAGSFGGDECLDRCHWDIGGVALTAHDLSLAGPDRFQVAMNDGDTRLVPVEVRNDAAVDDLVEVSVDDPRGVVDVGLRASGSGFSDSVVMRIPAGETRTVWVNVSAEFGGPPGEHPLDEIAVEARSLFAQRVFARAVLDVTLTILQRADLEIREMSVDGFTDESVVQASEHTQVRVTLETQNVGPLSIPEGEPVLVRLYAQECDEDAPEDRSRCGERVIVGEDVVTQGFERRCFGGDCVHVTAFEWVPDRRGFFRLSAEVNLPLPGDPWEQIPEAVLGNNDRSRAVAVGPVRLADLHVHEVRVVPFTDGRCGSPQEGVDRIIDDHPYCVVARVANSGSRAALNPMIDYFRADVWFSGGQGDGDAPRWSPLRLEPLSEQWVASTPLRVAHADTTQGIMEFRVEVETDSPVASVAGMERRLRIGVDDYDLELRSDQLPELLLVKGGEASLRLDVRNAGTAIATPVVHVMDADDAGGLRFQLVQPPPLQPGETTLVTLVARATHSSVEGTRQPEVFLSTKEDPLVRTPVPVKATVVADGALNATLLPLAAPPGPARLDFVVDNSNWSTDATWTPFETSGVLTLEEPGPLATTRNDVGIHEVDVRVPAHTPPGTQAGTILFEVRHGAAATNVEVPYTLDVLPAPALEAALVRDQIAVVRGVDANVTIRLENPGNQDIEAILETQVDSGGVPQNETAVYLEPGTQTTMDVRVRPGEASRTLGETLVRWRVAPGDIWHDPDEPLLWTIRHVPAAVRLESTNLDQVEPRLGRTETVRATLLNPGNEPVQAEAVLFANAEMHSREQVTLQPGALTVVQLHFRLDVPGEQALQIIVRPDGSQVTLADSVFHDVADAAVRELVIEDDPAGREGGDASSRMAPAAPMVLFVFLLALVMVWLRRPGPPGRCSR